VCALLTHPKAHAAMDRRLVACAIWLHAAYIGAASAAVGMLELLVPEALSPAAFLLALSGGALAACAWSRAVAALEPRASSWRAATRA
jgi:hypothetical protein